MTPLTDIECIQAVLKGKPEQYAILVNKYKDFVFTLSVKCIGNRELAEEAAQDTFLKAYKSLSTFRGKSKFSTWLYRICYFTCMDYLKKKSILTEDIETSTLPQVAVDEDVLEKLAADERNETVSRAMQKLAGEQKFVLRLYYFDDLTTDELANVLGVSVNYAKQKLFRARKQLEKILVLNAKELISNYG